MDQTSQSDGIVKAWPGNPRYLAYLGKPVILITSAEMYGAVVNLDFDYIAYLDKLAKYEMNYTRIYPGAFVEREGMFMKENNLAVKAGRLSVPWARSGVPGYANGGNKFDLDRWDEGYFARLRDFISQAERRGIVVEVCFFNCQYPESWPDCPLNAPNNIQGIEDCAQEEFQTMRYPRLVREQENYVRKITQEVNPFDNVILEMIDEPTLKGTPGVEATAWVGHLLDVVVGTERSLPKKHVVAQQVETGVDFSADCRVDLITTQYVEQNENRQVGGIEALDREYGHGKPIEMNETCVYPIWYAGDPVLDSRVEAWEFLVGGGAAFNHLNSLFNIGNPAGDTPDNDIILGALRTLKHFLYGFCFETMRQDKGFIQRAATMRANMECMSEEAARYAPAGARIRCLSEPGRQYAVYIHHGVINEHLSYIVARADYITELQVDLPGGKYACEWIDPETGGVVASRTLVHPGRPLPLTSPKHKIDIALKIMRLA